MPAVRDGCGPPLAGRNWCSRWSGAWVPHRRWLAGWDRLQPSSKQASAPQSQNPQSHCHKTLSRPAVTSREEDFYDLSLEIDQNCSLTSCLRNFRWAAQVCACVAGGSGLGWLAGGRPQRLCCSRTPSWPAHSYIASPGLATCRPHAHPPSGTPASSPCAAPQRRWMRTTNQL